MLVIDIVALFIWIFCGVIVAVNIVKTNRNDVSATGYYLCWFTLILSLIRCIIYDM